MDGYMCIGNGFIKKWDIDSMSIYNNGKVSIRVYEYMVKSIHDIWVLT